MSHVALFAWLNANAGAIQALSTIALVIITMWYAAATHGQLKSLRKAAQPDVLVTISFGVSTPDFTNIILIQAANRGQLPVTVNPPFLQLPDGKTMAFLFGFARQDRQFPAKLEPGEGCTVQLILADFPRQFIEKGHPEPLKLRAGLRDRVGNTFLSEPFSFQPLEHAGRAQEL